MRTSPQVPTKRAARSARLMVGVFGAVALAAASTVAGVPASGASGAAALSTEVLPNADWELVGEVQAGGGPAVALGQAGALLTGYGEDGKRVYRYDPATGIRRVADSPAPLGAHFLARLADGRVLVGGGGGGFDPEIRARCFIYDPARDRWSEAAPLPRPTYWFYVNPAVTLPDGRVMVTGGGTPEAAYFDPGVGVNLHLASRQVLLFDPTGKTVGVDGRKLTGAWREGAPMPTTRVFTHGPTFASNRPGIALAAPYHAGRVAHETVVLNDGRVLLVGGREYQPGLYYGLPSIDAYDPASDSWDRLGQMPSIPGEDGAYGGRGFPGVTLLRSGQVLIFGGNSGELLEHEDDDGGVTYTGVLGNSRGSSLLFDPSTRVFTRVGDLNVERFGPLAAPWLGGGGAFAIGGSPRGRAGMPHSGEVYDPATRAWFLLPPEPEQEPDFPRREGVTLTDGTVLTWTGETTTVRRLLPDG